MKHPIATLAFTLSLGLSAVSSSSAAADAGRKLDLGKDQAYEHVIRPIFAANCYSCHGEEKKKGKLEMHTPEAIMKGGSEGDTVVPGDLEGSLAWFRMTLPLDDDEVMPPEDEKQLSAEQKKLVAWWIEQGASFDKKISELKMSDEIRGILGGWQVVAVKAPEKKEVVVDMPPAADEAAVKTISDGGVLIMPLAQDSTFLSANVLNVADSFGDAQVKQLSPTSKQLTWLNLARSKVTDKSAADLAGLTTLTKLHLENTAISDAAMAQLAKLTNLEYLNLYGTKVTDAGIKQLAGLKKLKRLYVWQTGVTEKGAEALEKAIPGLEVNLGWKAPPVEEKKEEPKTAEAKNAPAKAKPAEAKKEVAKKPAPATPKKKEAQAQAKKGGAKKQAPAKKPAPKKDAAPKEGA